MTASSTALSPFHSQGRPCCTQRYQYSKTTQAPMEQAVNEAVKYFTYWLKPKAHAKKIVQQWNKVGVTVLELGRKANFPSKKEIKEFEVELTNTFQQALEEDGTFIHEWDSDEGEGTELLASAFKAAGLKVEDYLSYFPSKQTTKFGHINNYTIAWLTINVGNLEGSAQNQQRANRPAGSIIRH